MGLSTQIFGEEGAFVQSDMQFAQLAVADIRKMRQHKIVDRLDDDIAMDLNMRLFKTEEVNAEGKTAKLEATQLSIEYDQFLIDAR